MNIIPSIAINTSVLRVAWKYIQEGRIQVATIRNKIGVVMLYKYLQGMQIKIYVMTKQDTVSISMRVFSSS